jgi:hypothetical protein
MTYNPDVESVIQEMQELRQKARKNRELRSKLLCFDKTSQNWDLLDSKQVNVNPNQYMCFNPIFARFTSKQMLDHVMKKMNED